MLYMLQPAAACGFQVLVIRVTIYFEDLMIKLVIFRGNAELARTDRSMYICVSDDIKRRLTKKEAAAIKVNCKPIITGITQSLNGSRLLHMSVVYTRAPSPPPRGLTSWGYPNLTCLMFM